MNSEAQSGPPAWALTVPGQEDEFPFLDFNDMDITFPTFEDQSQNEDGNNPGENGGANSSNAQQQNRNVGGGGFQQQPHQHPYGGNPPAGNKDIMDLEHQARLRQQQQFYSQQQGHYQRHGVVPPTPDSLQMQAATLGNMGQMNMGGMGMGAAAAANQQRAVWEYNRKQQQDNMVFTPLVSPAVTPQDTQFARVPEYAVPGEYFSPLTSPALNAQHPHSQPRSYGSSASEAVSPVDMDVDSPVTQGNQTSQNQKQKPSRRSTKSQNTKTPAGRAVRQSPAMKPHRAKKSSSTVIPPRDIADIMEGFDDGQINTESPDRPGSERLNLPQSQASSETGSISPEPLNEILMPPPATPRPGTAGRSPNIPAQDQLRVNGAKENPATPASLMRLQKSGSAPRSNPSPRLGPTSAAGLSIPNSPAAHHSPASGSNLGKQKPELQLDTQMDDDNQATPTLTARNGPASAPMSAMGGATPIGPSPAGTPIPSASSTVASPNGRTTFALAPGSGRQAQAKGKKRNSSSHASPALRPRISPSIKPLLPEGANFTPETSALLLASKSNYQNILEGNKLPGVIYPDALSENLTSKRTSHKIAEQGRRNRINTALQEIAALLPQSGPAVGSPSSSKDGVNGTTDGRDGNGKDANGKGAKGKERTGSNPAASSSKANTVEMAIEYIKALQVELKEVKGKLAVAEKKLGERDGTEPSSKSPESGLCEENMVDGETERTVRDNTTKPGE